MRDVFRRLDKDAGDSAANRRRETREEVVGGFAEIDGEVHPLKNWSPNGFCIGPTRLLPRPGKRLDVSFTIPLPERTLQFRCRIGVMRRDAAKQEIGGVFFNLPDEVQAVVDEHFDVKAPQGYGASLFEKLRAALRAS